MSNEVTIDDAKLVAEADAALASLPADDAGMPAANEPLVESWVPTIESITPMLRLGVFPQWDISDAEATEFSRSLGACLDMLFPGGLNGKYACFARLIACCGGIVAVRAIQFGKIPPLGPKRVAKQKTDADADAGATDRKAA